MDITKKKWFALPLEKKGFDICCRGGVYITEKVMEIVQWRNSIILTDGNRMQMSWAGLSVNGDNV